MEFSSDQLEKIRNFKWVDDEPGEGEEEQPGSHFAGEVLDCAKKVCDFVLNGIAIEKFDENRFSIQIPFDIHPLLSERYNSQWSNASRTAVFDVVKAACITEIEAHQNIVEEKVRTIFPSQATTEQKEVILQYIESSYVQTKSEVGVIDKQYKLVWVRMYDEPVVNARMGAHIQVEDLIAKPEIVIELGMERVPIE